MGVVAVSVVIRTCQNLVHTFYLLGSGLQGLEWPDARKPRGSCRDGYFGGYFVTARQYCTLKYDDMLI
jgi:hypothetical protein